ncbi:cytochrome c [Tsuneonella sp. YG55]|uniref:Cytochrome c n=1 Tax=Tsuneonella litorea TaxID=2976475 RepID=A0A9X2W1V4_9SPHN|nr:cytochrome c [Tsuneonella litorea]MCT2558415.1 cytochrome c [Tsuneonella litorea]
MRTFFAIAACAFLAGCQSVAPRFADAGGLSDPGSLEARGYKLAVNRCSDCHSVGYGETSPVPQAPSFSAIANTPGLTSAMLAQWMRDHRNYPEEMYFEIPAEQIDELAAYVLTLRRTEAEPPG